MIPDKPKSNHMPVDQRLTKRQTKYIEQLHADYQTPIKLLLSIKGSKFGPSGVVMFRKAIKLQMTVGEIEQACWTGVIRAAQLFDARRNIKFTTFASTWIRSHVRGEIEKRARWSREIPASVMTTRSGEGRELSPLDTMTGSEPDPFDDADGIYPLSARFLRHLTKTEKIVIRRRYGIDSGYTETLEEIAKSLRLTKERIRQIQRKALVKMRVREGVEYAE